MGNGMTNFLRAWHGQILTAAEILAADLRVIKVCDHADRGDGAEPAMIQLPQARRWEGKDLTIIDASRTGFRLVTQDDEPFLGDAEKRLAVRLVPLISDGEPGSWGIL
jgi:hypothetical protein